MSSPDSSDAAIVDELVRKVQLESASGGPGPKLYAAPPSQPKTREDMWFIHWNVNNDPKEISCTVALDTAVWCIGKNNKFRSLYLKGEFDRCEDSWNQFAVCLKAMGMAKRDPEKARKLLELKAKNVSQYEPPIHVWKFRERPPAFWSDRGATSQQAQSSKGSAFNAS